MSWSYSGNPASSPLDEARYLIGDNDTEDQLIADEEINYTLASNTNKFIACAVCCEVLARKYSREADAQMGSNTLKVMASQRATAFAKRAAELRKQCTSKATPYSIANDTSVSRTSIFKHGMMSDG